MNRIYRTDDGEREVRERYLAFLKHWPGEHQQIRIPTSQGETFVVASGPPDGPAVLLLHGSAANSAMWMADAPVFARAFRVYVVDVIGEPGLSAPARPPLASDAYASWIDDVLDGLSIDRTSIVGVSLGGWLALDYATRRPERVEQVAVLSPAGVGRQKLGIVFRSMLLRLCGPWGKRKLAEHILGRSPAALPGPAKAFVEFVRLIHRHFRPRMVRLPIFPDEALRRLHMPLLAIVGGRDVLLDSAGTKRRLEELVPCAEVTYLDGAGHFIPGQTGRIMAFLMKAVAGSQPIMAASCRP